MTEHYDVLVVGAGPAGLAAARAASSHGATVGLLDAQPSPGGQVWRRDVSHAAPGMARRAIQAIHDDPRIVLRPREQVVAIDDGALLVEGPRGAFRLTYDALVLATGARELNVPFPGWTLPRVSGAGGLQALTKQGMPLDGQRVLVAGSGPLLLATAATARRHGATLVGIHEQAERATLMRFAGGLWRWPGKGVQAIALRVRLAGTPYVTGSIVRRVDERAGALHVTVDDGRKDTVIVCDRLAIGYGLVPETGLAQLLGCALTAHDIHPAVATDDDQRTSVANVFAAGEACGIGGRDKALVEGEIAGHMATGFPASADRLHASRRRARRFGAALKVHFALRPAVRQRALPDTLICRCEDVPLSAIDGMTDARTAKLATRMGMGACQGRICGAAFAELRHASGGRGRPTLFPTRLATLAGTDFSCPTTSCPTQGPTHD